MGIINTKEIYLSEKYISQEITGQKKKTNISTSFMLSTKSLINGSLLRFCFGVRALILLIKQVTFSSTGKKKKIIYKYLPFT